MNAKKSFVDSNVILYLFGADDNRKKIAASFLSSQFIISTQVVNENVNACLKKFRLTKAEAIAHGQNLLDHLSVINIYPSTIIQAFRILDTYGYSFYDSLIISAALESNCEILYSEDMQRGHNIDNKLLIVNPFVPTDQ